MNNLIRHFILLVLAMTSLQVFAYGKGQDTVYFYNTWQQILDNNPAAMGLDPFFYSDGYSVAFESTDRNFNQNIRKLHIAVSMGDSLWLINSRYLKQNFKGDAKDLNDYVPLFYNDKVAYVVTRAKLSFKDIMMGDENVTEIDYYYIDFLNRKVLRVTPKVLSGLLEDYRDLLMRYEGMRDYNKRYIIEDYFFKFVDRATDDIMRPFILDLTE